MFFKYLSNIMRKARRKITWLPTLSAFCFPYLFKKYLILNLKQFLFKE